MLAAGQDAAVQRVCARWSGLTPRAVESAFVQPLLVPHPIEEALAALVHTQPDVTEAPRTALFQGGGAGLDGRLAILQRRPGELAEKPGHAGTLVIDVAHPLFSRATALPPAVGARVLVIAALRDVGNDEPVCSELLAGLT